MHGSHSLVVIVHSALVVSWASGSCVSLRGCSCVFCSCCRFKPACLFGVCKVWGLTGSIVVAFVLVCEVNVYTSTVQCGVGICTCMLLQVCSSSSTRGLGCLFGRLSRFKWSNSSVNMLLMGCKGIQYNIQAASKTPYGYPKVHVRSWIGQILGQVLDHCWTSLWLLSGFLLDCQ
jgi:hypothetical protein